MQIIAGTGPVNYLILIGHIDILPALFSNVILPSAVKDELADPSAPLAVRKWMAAAPPWVEVRNTAKPSPLVSIPGLGPGETAAILLAEELHVDLLLMDDRRGVMEAIHRGVVVTGTMGLLARAAKRGLLNLTNSFDLLKQTNFRYPQETMDALLAEALGSHDATVKRKST